MAHMAHRGAGVAVRAAYHEDQRVQREELTAQLAAGTLVAQPQPPDDMVEVPANEIEVGLSHPSYPKFPPREKKKARRERRQSEAEYKIEAILDCR